MVISKLSSGGAERVAVTLANHWAANGWDITVITLADESSDFYSLSESINRIVLKQPDRCVYAFGGACRNIDRIRSLRRELKKVRPQIAVGFMPANNIRCAIACARTGIVSMGSEHNHPPLSVLGPPWNFLRRVFYPRLAAVSALTTETAEWLRTNTGASRIPIMPNPIAFPVPESEPSVSPRHVKGLLGGGHLLLAAGRLSHQKGFDRLLDAFARLTPTHPDWRLAILGEGPLRTELEQKRDQLGLGSLVAMPGAVGNIGAWYEAADAYVMTSRWEGFGNTLAEAMAYGVPSISVDCDTGPRDIVRNEQDGLLVPQNDQDALVSALGRVMSDQDLRKKFSKRAIEARDRFYVANVAQQWEEVFEDLLKHSA